MSSYAERLAVDIRNAYEGRDRDAMESALTRMVAAIAYTGPLPQASPETAGTITSYIPGAAPKFNPDGYGVVVIDAVHPRSECARKLLGCECTTPEQRDTCMFHAT